MSNTDWDSVTVIGKRQQSAKSTKTASALNSASRSGTSIISEKKQGLNQKKGSEGSRIAKVDRMTDVYILIGRNIRNPANRQISRSRNHGRTP